MTLLPRLLLLAALALGAAPAHAATPYVPASMIDVAALLQPPPDAAATAVEIAAVRALQAQTSEARKAQALVDADESVEVMFAGALGGKVTLATLPATSTLFSRVGASEGATTKAAKALFARVRPWIATADVHVYTKPSKTPSYPSGHTTRVTLAAIVLTAMVPERAPAIWARAADYAQSRVIGGMHYPSDIEAGWRTGTAVAALLLQQPDFKADFAVARDELRTALGLPARP